MLGVQRAGRPAGPGVLHQLRAALPRGLPEHLPDALQALGLAVPPVQSVPNLQVSPQTRGGEGGVRPRRCPSLHLPLCPTGSPARTLPCWCARHVTRATILPAQSQPPRASPLAPGSARYVLLSLGGRGCLSLTAPPDTSLLPSQNCWVCSDCGQHPAGLDSSCQWSLGSEVCRDCQQHRATADVPTAPEHSPQPDPPAQM